MVDAAPARSRARGFRIVASALVLLLLAVILIAVVAPWSPSTAVAPAALFGDQATSRDLATPTFPSEAKDGTHLAASVSIAFDRTAVATG